MSEIKTLNNHLIRIAEKIYKEKLSTGKNKIILSAQDCNVQNPRILEFAIETLHQKYAVIRRIEKNNDCFGFYVDMDKLAYLLDTISYRIAHRDPFLELRVEQEEELEIFLFSPTTETRFPILKKSVRHDVCIRDYLVRLTLLSHELPDVSLFEIKEYDLNLFQTDLYKGYHFLDLDKLDSGRLVKHVSEYVLEPFKSIYHSFIQAGTSRQSFYFRSAITQFQFDSFSDTKKRKFAQSSNFSS